MDASGAGIDYRPLTLLDLRPDGGAPPLPWAPGALAAHCEKLRSSSAASLEAVKVRTGDPIAAGRRFSRAAAQAAHLLVGVNGIRGKTHLLDSVIAELLNVDVLWNASQAIIDQLSRSGELDRVRRAWSKEPFVRWRNVSAPDPMSLAAWYAGSIRTAVLFGAEDFLRKPHKRKMSITLHGRLFTALSDAIHPDPSPLPIAAIFEVVQLAGYVPLAESPVTKAADDFALLETHLDRLRLLLAQDGAATAAIESDATPSVSKPRPTMRLARVPDEYEIGDRQARRQAKTWIEDGSGRAVKKPNGAVFVCPYSIKQLWKPRRVPRS